MRWVFFTLVLCVALGCARHGKQDQIIRIALESEPLSLDPRLSVDAYSAKLNQLIYRGLFTYNETLELIPDLVDRDEVVSPTQFRFTLKPDLYFHDGSPLTAEDVVYSYNWVLDPTHRSPHREGIAMIQKIEARSPREIEIVLREPYAPFLNRLTLGIVPARRGEDPKFAEHPMGAGPFRFAYWERGQFMQLERVARGSSEHERSCAAERLSPAAPQDRECRELSRDRTRIVEFWFLPDENLRLLELIHGRIDLVQNGISPALLPVLERNPTIVIEGAPGINLAYLGFQLAHPILGKREVRRAIAMAIDRAQLIKHQLRGKARLADSLFAPENWAHGDGLPRPDFDPEAAKRLLDAAGFPDPDGKGPLPRFHLTYKTSAQKDRIEMALLIAEFLQAIGIRVSVESREWGTFFRDIGQGRFELFSLTWVGLVDPDVLYTIFHSASIPPKGANRGYYRSDVVDALVERARRSYDRNERKRLYTEVQTILADDLPYVFLWYEDNSVARQRSLCGYAMRANASFIGLERAYRGQCHVPLYH